MSILNFFRRKKEPALHEVKAELKAAAAKQRAACRKTDTAVERLKRSAEKMGEANEQATICFKELTKSEIREAAKYDTKIGLEPIR